MDKSTPQIEVIPGIIEIIRAISLNKSIELLFVFFLSITLIPTADAQVDSITALRLHYLGVKSYQNENYEVGLSQYLAGLEIREQLFQSPHPELARSNLNIGILFNVIDKFISAKAYLLKAISQYEILKNESLLATAYNEMGWCFQNLGDYKNALLYQQKAITLQEKMFGKNDFQVGYSLGQLAITHDELGDHHKAIDLLQQALQINTFIKDSFEIAITLHNLGDSYDGNKEYDKAIKYLNEAISIYTSLGPEYLEESIFSLNNLSLVYAHKGDFAQAIALGDSVLQLKKKLFGLNNNEVAISLNNLGNFYDAKKQYRKAQAYYFEALSMMRNSEEHIFALTILKDQLNSLIQSSHIEEENNLQKIDTTIQLIHRQIDKIKSQHENSESTLYWIAEAREIHLNILEYFLKKFHLQKNKVWAERAFLEIERSKSLVLLEEFRKNQLENNASSYYTPSERSIQSKVAYWSLKSEELDSAFVDSLFYWNNKLIRLKSKNQLNKSLISPQVKTGLCDEIKMLLGSKIACLNLLDLKDSMLIVYASNDFWDFYKVPKPEKGIDDLHLRKVQENLVLKKHLVIIPDGTMMNKSWETILITEAEEKDKYLIDKINISYHFSAQLLLESQKKHQKINRQNTIAFISPDFSQHASLLPLSNAEKEWTNTSNLFPNHFYYHQKSFTDFDLTLVKGDILHISTHAAGDTTSMYSSHLIWPESVSTIIPLYNWQIENMQLNHQLAVLASCETGLGKISVGEGMTNIGRSMMHAGIPNILISNWKANDVSTSQIIIDWYKKLAKGVHPSVALRSAKLAYINNPADESGDPAYWGHLTYWGDLPNYESSKNIWILFSILLITSLGLFVFLIRKFILKRPQEVPSI